MSRETEGGATEKKAPPLLNSRETVLHKKYKCHSKKIGLNVNKVKMRVRVNSRVREIN